MLSLRTLLVVSLSFVLLGPGLHSDAPLLSREFFCRPFRRRCLIAPANPILPLCHANSCRPSRAACFLSLCFVDAASMPMKPQCSLSVGVRCSSPPRRFSQLLPRCLNCYYYTLPDNHSSCLNAICAPLSNFAAFSSVATSVWPSPQYVQPQLTDCMYVVRDIDCTGTTYKISDR